MSGSTLRRRLERHPGFWLLFRELGLWHDLLLWGRGKELLTPGAVALRSRKGQLVLPSAVTAASVIEIIAVELLLASATMRMVLAALSVYGVVMLWAFIASHLVRPHFVAADDAAHTTGVLVLRQGRTVLCEIPIEHMTQITIRRGFASERRKIETYENPRQPDESGAEEKHTTAPITPRRKLVLGGANGTNLRIMLSQPITVPDDTWPWQQQRHSAVECVELWVDEPNQAMEVLPSIASH